MSKISYIFFISNFFESLRSTLLCSNSVFKNFCSLINACFSISAGVSSLGSLYVFLSISSLLSLLGIICRELFLYRQCHYHFLFLEMWMELFCYHPFHYHFFYQSIIIITIGKIIFHFNRNVMLFIIIVIKKLYFYLFPLLVFYVKTCPFMIGKDGFC